MKKVKCIEGFLIDKCDDDGFIIENEYIEVEEGTICEVENDNFRVIGGEVRLLGVDSNTFFEWLEISKETFEEYFEAIE